MVHGSFEGGGPNKAWADEKTYTTSFQAQFVAMAGCAQGVAKQL